MNVLLIALQAAAVLPAVTGQVDVVCRAYCSFLAVQDGVVRFIEQSPRAPRSVAIRRYNKEAQQFIPEKEVSVGNFRSPRGWRIVESAFLDHADFSAGLHIRFFGPDGVLRQTADGMLVPEQSEVGHLFGGADDIFAVTSTEEHAYNTQTEIWYLPESGGPKSVLRVLGVYRRFAVDSVIGGPGVVIDRQIYDGVHAETKGTVRELYAWDRKRKSLKLKEK